MDSKVCRSIIFVLLLIGATFAITYVVTRNHFEHDHSIPVSTTSTTTPTPLRDIIITAPSSPTPTPLQEIINSTTTTKSPTTPVSSSRNPLRCDIRRRKRTLIVYDTNSNNRFAYLGELYAVVAKNLISKFQYSDVVHLNNYTSLCGYHSVMYIGYNFRENPNLQNFIDHTMANMDEVNIFWMGTNIWKMVNTTTENQFGFRYVQSRKDVRQIYYKGEWISRDIRSDSISETQIFDHHRADMLAYTYLDNKHIPWALTSNRNFLYLSEIPFSFIDHDDRFIIFHDLLYEFYNVHTHRQRAMVRLEDIGPHYKVEDFLAAVNYLKSQNIPFSFGVFPVYVKKDVTIRLRERPLMVDALRRAIESGGTMVYHGYTHQYYNYSNPYNTESGSDFEFYMAHVDPVTTSVIYDGPVPKDSVEWIRNRIQEGFDEFEYVGFKRPEIFEFPHYAGSDLDYRVIADMFPYRYDRGTYYIGTLNNSTNIDHSKKIQYFTSYVTRDVYGSVVIPENMGNYVRTAINNNENRDSADLIETARLNKNIIRDSLASFFYHPYLGVEYLTEIVSGIKQLGYEFVSVNEMVKDFNM